MSLQRVPSLLHRSKRLLPQVQRRWAQVHDVRFLTNHNTSTILEKYQAKLQQKAKEAGKSVEELRDIYKDKIDELRRKAIVPGANAPLAQPLQAQKPFDPPPPPQPQRSRQDGIKTLSSFVDVEKLSALPRKEIENVWRVRHMNDAQSLCAVMSSDVYNRISTTAQQHPQFILPIPRDEGAEIHFMQWTFPSKNTATVLFTHLAEFKLKGEYAQPHTTITHHTDISETNGLVLLEGRVQENRGIAVDEARWLLLCLQKFYGFEANSDAAKQSFMKRRQLMKQFSEGDTEFKIQDLLEEAEKVP